MDYVRLCPVCGAENLPSLQRCACGTLLMGVDLTLKEAMVAPEPIAPANALVCPRADCGQPNPSGATKCFYCNHPLAPPASPAAEPVGDLNFCKTTGRPLGHRVFLDGPWQQALELRELTIIGRDSGLPDEVKRSLEKQFDNVSRRHAEFRFEKGELWLADLGSSNGTFVNEARLAANVPVRLFNGARVRFAADLVVTVRIDESKV